MRNFTVVCVWRFALRIVGSSKRTGAGSRWDPGSVVLAVAISQGCSVARESRLWYCCLLRLVLEGIKTLESVLPLPEMFLSSLCCCGPLSWPCHLQEGEELSTTCFQAVHNMWGAEAELFVQHLGSTHRRSVLAFVHGDCMLGITVPPTPQPQAYCWHTLGQ